MCGKAANKGKAHCSKLLWPPLVCMHMAFHHHLPLVPHLEHAQQQHILLMTL
jgi:hypothetical protein